MVQAEVCWHRSLAPLKAQVREQLGAGSDHHTLDVDGLDPSCAPGTGTPEIGGLTTVQGMEVIRGCHGLDLIGGDVVEVAPPFDPTGNTALVGATMMYEILCPLAQAVAKRKGRG